MNATRLTVCTLVLCLALVACGSAPAPPAVSTPAAHATSAVGAALGTSTPAATAAGGPVAPASPAGAASPGATTKLTIALGYIPDIQFAPFYMAKEGGYFRDAGLDVDFNQSVETDVLKLVGTGALKFGVASGDEVMVARSQGVPVVYVAAWYQKYPVTIVARASANIHGVRDLKGHTVGVPGRFGTTYTGLLALLQNAGMSQSDIQIREVGFNQVQALSQNQVDAIVGYTNNEPIQLKNLGVDTTTINVFDQVDLVSNGIVTNEQTLRDNSDLVRKVVGAVLRGTADTIAHPDTAVDTTLAKYVPEAKDKRALERQILDATIPLWQSPVTAQHGLGYSDPAAWTTTKDVLTKLKMLGGDVDLSKVYTNQFVPTGR
ncbi:MAG TPA: ABC transporter substrate-binding protein [Thermomicrobiales bacterium]|nr:ABC transporter substrate-binding protein [Thermomicrobiales bacterium]